LKTRLITGNTVKYSTKFILMIILTSFSDEAERKINQHQNKAIESTNEASSLNDQLADCQKERIAEAAAFEQKLSVHEETIRHMKQTYKRDMEEKDRDIEIKCNNLDNIMEEYQRSKREKDMLNNYRKMIESEEHRFNIPLSSGSVDLVKSVESE